jgi:N-glycosylase/DNA lyase
MNHIQFCNCFTIAVKDFNLQQTLECGQCFRYYKLKDNAYLVLAKDQAIKIVQAQEKLNFYCSEAVYQAFWKNYFDLDRDYRSIKVSLSEKDDYLKTAIADKHGVRILQQEPWEMLISFIISQTKQIPHIKKLIEVLAQQYGTFIGVYDNISYYSFPTPKQLKDASEEDFRKLKIGFRASYIVDAVNKIESGTIDLDAIKKMSDDEAREVLMTIKGVGHKIADCVLLFGYNRYAVFPTDVWVKRIVEFYYKVNGKNMDMIQSFAKSYFGEYAGFAQQYLFYHARDNKIGK